MSGLEITESQKYLIMKAQVINRYIDNKIYSSICQKMEIDDVVKVLKERIKNTESLIKPNKYKNYMATFSQKRIEDIFFVKNKFKNVPNNKILNLIQLKDKLSGIDIEIDL